MNYKYIILGFISYGLMASAFSVESETTRSKWIQCLENLSQSYCKDYDKKEYNQCVSNRKRSVDLAMLDVIDQKAYIKKYSKMNLVDYYIKRSNESKKYEKAYYLSKVEQIDQQIRASRCLSIATIRNI